MSLSVALLAVIGVLDAITAEEVSLSIFYLVPVALAAWMLGRRSGLLVSALGAVEWFVTHGIAAGHHWHSAVLDWNTVVAFGSFLVVTFAMSALRDSLAMQDELNSFIVHDLRSPLTNVLSGLEVLEEMAPPTLGSGERQIIEMGIISGHRMLTLIDSLLDVPKMERKRLTPHFDDVTVGAIVERALEQVRMWADHNEIGLNVQMFNTEAALKADLDLTSRVLINLLSNALKVSPKGSCVTVSAEPCKENEIAFSVTDQGPGIGKEHAGRVFDKYGQLEARKEGAPVGSGLGLTFCKLAVEAQGGKIWLTSERGKGATFTFALPTEQGQIASSD
jgi:signal transduction histidine kinase